MTDSSCAAAAHWSDHCPWQLVGAQRTLAKVPGHMSIRITCVTSKTFLQFSGPQQTRLGTRDHSVCCAHLQRQGEGPGRQALAYATRLLCCGQSHLTLRSWWYFHCISPSLQQCSRLDSAILCCHFSRYCFFVSSICICSAFSLPFNPGCNPG